MTARITQLRSTLRKLRAVPFDKSNVNTAMAPQEMLDFLAMVDGIKPVYLLGRGFDDPSWIEGVKGISRKKALHVVDGSYWEAVNAYADIPAPIASIMRSGTADAKAIYIAKKSEIAKEVMRISAAGTVSIEEEARLLDYPVCCVRDHYERDAAMQKAFWLMLRRTANNDEKEIERLIREDVGIEPKTEEEKQLLTRATTMNTAPFTSIHMCGACFKHSHSPALTIARKYEQLAQAVDRNLWTEIQALEQHLN